MNCSLERARIGDPAAIRHLVDELRPRIWKMAAYYARRCGDDADDLAQEAWLALLEALPQLDLSIGQPEQYLIARARWKMLDSIKREHIRKCVSLDDSLADAICPAASDNPLESACVSEFAIGLQPTQRAILGCLLSGLTWRETGERLGCASANVAYHVKKIRRRYEEWM